jgi:hypothetical protein
LHFSYPLATLTVRSLTNYSYQILTAMKSKTIFHYSNFPLKVVGENKQEPDKLQLLRIIEKGESKNQRFGFIENKAIQDSVNWDPSWFANYE